MKALLKDLGEHDAYLVLGLHRTATRQEVKTAYRRLIMDHHPDRTGRSADGPLMRRIDVARAILEEHRSEYDAHVSRLRKDAAHPARSRAHGTSASPPPSREPEDTGQGRGGGRHTDPGRRQTAGPGRTSERASRSTRADAQAGPSEKPTEESPRPTRPARPGAGPGSGRPAAGRRAPFEPPPTEGAEVPRWNRAAVKSVLLFWLPVVPVLLALTARGEIAVTGQRGRRLAAVGLVLGVLYTVGWLVRLLVAAF